MMAQKNSRVYTTFYTLVETGDIQQLGRIQKLLVGVQDRTPARGFVG